MGVNLRPRLGRLKCVFLCICVTSFVGFYIPLYITCLSESRGSTHPARTILTPPDEMRLYGTFTNKTSGERHGESSTKSVIINGANTNNNKNNNNYYYNNNNSIGPGANGKGVLRNIKLSEQSRRLLDVHKSFHGFDTFASDVVDIKRKLPDLRSEACRNIVYQTDLPAASVVIIFRDEWTSVLLRTVYSVLGNTPIDLLKEIVLVDDGSTDAELVTKVDLHVANLRNVILVRNSAPLGLMVARDKGIQATSSEYFVVMDSHMEVGPGWLEPVVNRLVENKKVVLCSKIGVINGETFEYKNDRRSLTVFPFFDPLTLDQIWVEFSREFKARYPGNLLDLVDPVPYGMVQGMNIAMTKGFYNQLGGFDTGMKVWGSEQLELSIKAWMCGGRVEMVPCSQMAHLFRHTPWTRQNGAESYVNVNKGRLVKVWMDSPYADNLAEIVKTHLNNTGNLSDRHEIRKINKCKPYGHFVKMVQSFSDVYIPKHPIHRGSIVNRHFNMCLSLLPFFNKKREEDKTKRNLGLTKCNKQNGNQYFLFSEDSELRSVHCKALKYSGNGHGQVLANEMPSVSKDQSAKWEVRDVSNGYAIVNTGTGLCLTAMTEGQVTLVTCQDGPRQLWLWE